MNKFRILTILYCMECLISEIFFSDKPENYYDDCLCATCGADLNMANSFGQIRHMKKPSDLTMMDMGINSPPFGPASASGRMSIINDIQTNQIKRRHT